MNPYVACRQLIKRRNQQTPTPLLHVAAVAPPDRPMDAVLWAGYDDVLFQVSTYNLSDDRAWHMLNCALEVCGLPRVPEYPKANTMFRLWESPINNAVGWVVEKTLSRLFAECPYALRKRSDNSLILSPLLLDNYDCMLRVCYVYDGAVSNVGDAPTYAVGVNDEALQLLRQLHPVTMYAGPYWYKPAASAPATTSAQLCSEYFVIAAETEHHWLPRLLAANHGGWGRA